MVVILKGYMIVRTKHAQYRWIYKRHLIDVLVMIIPFQLVHSYSQLREFLSEVLWCFGNSFDNRFSNELEWRKRRLWTTNHLTWKKPISRDWFDLFLIVLSWSNSKGVDALIRTMMWWKTCNFLPELYPVFTMYILLNGCDDFKVYDKSLMWRLSL